MSIRSFSSRFVAPAASGWCPRRAGRAAHAAQRGFSLIEVSIVTAIVLLIAVIGIPTIGNYVLENRVPKVGEELARFVVHMRVNAEVAGDRPFETIGVANLRTAVEGSTVLLTTDDGTVQHGLGSKGVVEVAPTDGGDGFVVRLVGVSHVACPSIASVLQRVAERITISDGSRDTTVKDDDTPYRALAAEAACAAGNVNDFAFYVS